MGAELRFVSADLPVSFLGGGAFLQVKPFQDGVLPEFFLDGEFRELHFLFLFPLLDISEQVNFLVPGVYYVIGGEIQFPDGKARVYYTIKKFHDGSSDFF